MARDHYVIDIQAGRFEEHSNYCFVNSKVQPRTKDKDHVTKQDHYGVWIIFSNDENQNSHIHSAECKCKGGVMATVAML